MSCNMKSLNEWLNPFKVVSDIFNLTKDTHNTVKEIRSVYSERIDKIKSFEAQLKEERAERERERNLFLSVIDHLDDMLWAKDIDGKYIMANKAFREKFFYGLSWDVIKGKNDIEMAKICKDFVGNDNHTFGEVCGNSDVVIHETEEARQFLEHGKVDGKLMKLVVNKSPVFNHTGTMFATCGTGRDITDWHQDLEKAIKNICGACGKDNVTVKLLKVLNKLEFKEGDHVR